MKCCTKDDPCGEGFGGCEEGNGECMDGLKCGKGNCRAMHGGNLIINADLNCCYKPIHKPSKWIFKKKKKTIGSKHEFANHGLDSHV